MKTIFILIITLLSALTAFADAGRVHAVKFEAVYINPSNSLAWSKALPGLYTNGCTEPVGSYYPNQCTPDNLEPKAAKACREIGARLPTMEEYESLIRGFHSTEEDCGPKLTQIGKEEMHAVFGDMNNYRGFWTSSVGSYGAYQFVGVFGSYGFCSDIFIEYRSREAAVRCVLEP